MWDGGRVDRRRGYRRQLLSINIVSVVVESYISLFQIDFVVHQFGFDGPDVGHGPAVELGDLFVFGDGAAEGFDVVFLRRVDETLEKLVLPAAGEGGMLVLVALHRRPGRDHVQAQMHQGALEENVFGAPAEEVVVGAG